MHVCGLDRVHVAVFDFGAYPKEMFPLSGTLFKCVLMVITVIQLYWPCGSIPLAAI